MREIKLIRYEWNSDITDGRLTFTVDGQEKILTNAFYRECTVKWGEKFETWGFDSFARSRLIRGYDFNLSYEEVDFLEEIFNHKMNELSL